MEGPLQRQQQRSAKYRAVIQEAGRLKAGDLARLQARLQQRQDKIASLRAATEDEKRLLGCACSPESDVTCVEVI